MVVVVAGASLAACQLLAGIDRIEKEHSSATVDGGPDAHPSADDPCVHTRPPPPPPIDDDRDGVVPPFFVAIRTFSTIVPAGGALSGFDLDGVCTCDKRSGTFKNGGSSCTPRNDDCDGDGGVDNEGSKLFASFAPTGFSVDTLVNDNIAKGTRTLLLYISKYNGKPNDREVVVGAMITNGILDGSGCGTIVNPGRLRAPPGWCGHDRWSYPSDSVKLGTTEPAGTGAAYVNDGVLVYESELPMRIFFGAATVSFGSPITTGRLEKDASGFWKLNGMLGGRVEVGNLLTVLGNTDTKNDDGGTGLCTSPFFQTLKVAVCGSVDINRTSRLDFQDGPCDAISTAVTFTAEQVDVAEKSDETGPENECAVGRVAPGTYTCP